MVKLEDNTIVITRKASAQRELLFVAAGRFSTAHEQQIPRCARDDNLERVTTWQTPTAEH
jgi:hypothetical protein